MEEDEYEEYVCDISPALTECSILYNSNNLNELLRFVRESIPPIIINNLIKNSEFQMMIREALKVVEHKFIAREINYNDLF